MGCTTLPFKNSGMKYICLENILTPHSQGDLTALPYLKLFKIIP